MTRKTVYVSLYHSEGMSRGLSVWADMLKSIHTSLVSRPVFLSESDAKASLGQSDCWSYVQLSLPKSVVVTYEGRYLVRADHVTINHIQSFYWRNKEYRFNGICLSGADERDVASVLKNAALVDF